MPTWVQRAAAYHRLGAANVAAVAAYRAALRCPLSAVRRIRAAPPSGPFFKQVYVGRGLPPTEDWTSEGRLFGWLPVRWAEGGIPDWHRSPLTGVDSPVVPWWTIADFNAEAGDIKAWWNLSRFDWTLALAQRASEGREADWRILNAWVSDWIEKNPPYLGINWKCGQEASLRVLHLALAAIVGRQMHSPEPGLVDLVALHLQRIEPTIGYARAQNNDHGISEGAALFVGGAWLQAAGHAGGGRWLAIGRRFLEERTAALFSSDGGFSQYSVAYHRMVLDELALVEVVRRHLNGPSLSAAWYARAAAATRWLAAMADLSTGALPNIGANDSTELAPLGNCDLRDCRGSLQRAMSLFLERRFVHDEGPWDHSLRWFDLEPATGVADVAPPAIFQESGFVVARQGAAHVVLRFPKYRFRPAHADALHLDLWVQGTNLLRDDGTFSYAEWPLPDGERAARAHNTVQFDGRPQMPRVGRFLFGAWLPDGTAEPLEVRANAITGGASYGDAHGARHSRRFQLSATRLVVDDEVGGFRRTATLRWRLPPGPWQLQGQRATCGTLAVEVTSSAPVERVALCEGDESLRYLTRSVVPVLEVSVAEPGTFRSTIEW